MRLLFLPVGLNFARYRISRHPLSSCIYVSPSCIDTCPLPTLQPSKRPDVDTLLQQVAPHVASREQPVAARVQREPSKVISREELLQREAELRQYEEKLRSRERAISERERRLDGKM